MNISYSSAKLWKRCRRQWKYSYEWHLTKLVKDSHRMELGSIISEVLETYYASIKRGATLWDGCILDFFTQVYTTHHNAILEKLVEKRQEVTPAIEDYWKKIYKQGMDVLSGYQAYAQEHDKFKVEEIEAKRSLPLTDTVSFSYKPDLVVTDEVGMLAIVDHKLRGEFNKLEWELDEQLRLYSWAKSVQENLPYYPTVMYNLLTDKKGVEYYRGRVAPSPIMISRPVSTLFEVIKEMEIDTTRYPNPYNDCWFGKMCDFHQLCVCEEKGNDIPYTIDQFYERKEERK